MFPRYGTGMSLILEVPDAVAESLLLPPGERQQRLVIELACSLYAQQLLSFGKARELSLLDQASFAGELTRRDISRHYGAADLAQDLAYAGGQ